MLRGGRWCGRASDGGGGRGVRGGGGRARGRGPERRLLGRGGRCGRGRRCRSRDGPRERLRSSTRAARRRRTRRRRRGRRRRRRPLARARRAARRARRRRSREARRTRRRRRSRRARRAARARGRRARAAADSCADAQSGRARLARRARRPPLDGLALAHLRRRCRRGRVTVPSRVRVGRGKLARGAKLGLALGPVADRLRASEWSDSVHGHRKVAEQEERERKTHAHDVIGGDVGLVGAPGARRLRH